MQSKVPAENREIFQATENRCRPMSALRKGQEISLCTKMRLMRSLAPNSNGSARRLYIPRTCLKYFINHKTSIEPNNRCKSARTRQHNLEVLFLQQPQPDTPPLIPHYPQHQSVISNPQLHIPDQKGLHSHSPEQQYLQHLLTSKNHCYQDRRLELLLRRNSVCRASGSLMLQSQRNSSR